MKIEHTPARQQKMAQVEPDLRKPMNRPRPGLIRPSRLDTTSRGASRASAPSAGRDALK
jgi:hypothetical protein